jgi:PAS domain S-box-containing protein
VSDLSGSKKKTLKELIEKLHAGAKADLIKEKFKEILKEVSPTEIAQVEEELIKEGMPQEEIQKLCDVHLTVFKESLEKEKALAPPGHPIRILMEEHKILLGFANEFREIIKEIMVEKDSALRQAQGGEQGRTASVEEKMTKSGHIAGHFNESESHYIREENVLFPYLEKHGITQPPAIMWMEHDKIREIKKNVYKLLEAHDRMVFQDFANQLEEAAMSLAEMLSSHFYKENNILFPTALKVIDENEWKEIRHQFDELGYCSFTPESARITPEEMKAPTSKPEMEGLIPFETGNLSKEQIEAIFSTLPVEITFIDKEDLVRYFSQPKEMIFSRTKAIIGRQVQLCHPQKSVHVVNQILEDFKNGRKDVAEFWINLGGKLVYIRYFAVRNKNGEYLGCLEVTQDITKTKKIEGEKRLL